MKLETCFHQETNPYLAENLPSTVLQTHQCTHSNHDVHWVCHSVQDKHNLPSLFLLKWAETRHAWCQETENSTENRFKEAKDQQKEPAGLFLGMKKSSSRIADKTKKWNLSVFTYCDAWATENCWVAIHQLNCWKQLCSCFYHSPNIIKYTSIKWLLEKIFKNVKTSRLCRWAERWQFIQLQKWDQFQLQVHTLFIAALPA